MTKICLFFNVAHKIFISIGGISLIEFFNGSVFGLKIFEDIDNNIKTITAIAALIYLVVTFPFKVQIMIIDRKHKNIENEIKAIDKRIKSEELKKLERDNIKNEKQNE